MANLGDDFEDDFAFVEFPHHLEAVITPKDGRKPIGVNGGFAWDLKSKKISPKEMYEEGERIRDKFRKRIQNW